MLPFTNLSGDPAQDYFADGITENLYGAFGVKGFSMAAPKFCDGLIASVTARWHDCGEQVEVEINYSLEGLCGWAVSELVRQGVEPSGIFGLQCD